MNLTERILAWCEANADNQVTPHWLELTQHGAEWEEYSAALDKMRRTYAHGTGNYSITNAAFDAACHFLIEVFE